jgi:UDP-3-O-[3-hydroxymyristoyl] glucosamine N-acyltransferase
VQKPLAVVGSDLDLLDDMAESGICIAGYFSTRDKNIGFKYLGDHTNIKPHLATSQIVIAVDDPKFRKTLVTEFGSSISGYISPSASISKSTSIPPNLLAYPNVYISAKVTLGDFVKISVGAQIHHESIIGDFSVIAPRSLILGRVEIGSESFIGSGSTISPNCIIGSHVTIGMGSNVLRNLSDGLKAWGNPAREITP